MNPYHDANGRFTTGGYGLSITEDDVFGEMLREELRYKNAYKKGIMPRPKSIESFGLKRVSIKTEDWQHVLDGETHNFASGGHRYGTNRIHKTEFPKGWSDKQIMLAIELTNREPQKVILRGSKYSALRIVDNVLIEVQVIMRGNINKFIAAFPFNGTGVIRNLYNNNKQKVPLNIERLT